MQLSEQKAYTVTAITRLIKHTLEESFPSVWVEGEISNYIHHTSGHRYLNLKDDNATIKLTIWRSAGAYLKFEPENGMKVRAFGDISVYEKGGNYQLNCRKLVPLGVGELEIAFRQLFEKLAKEGLFDEDRKRPLPDYPRKIGVVTSPTGAAIRDIIKIASRRNDSIKIVLYPAQVQGKGAELTIISGIEYFNGRDDIDVVIIGRGGGSIEDLWCFNEESLVRAIVDSDKPIVSAVGHEIDTTLSDLAADLRAPTPSAAAEMVFWDKRELLEQLIYYYRQWEKVLAATIREQKRAVIQYAGRPVFKRPEDLILNRQQYLDGLSRLLESGGKSVLEKKKNSLSLSVSKLETLSPLAVLNRGYAVVKDAATGQVIKSVEEIKIDDRTESIMVDGSILARVEKVKRTDKR